MSPLVQWILFWLIVGKIVVVIMLLAGDCIPVEKKILYVQRYHSGYATTTVCE